MVNPRPSIGNRLKPRRSCGTLRVRVPGSAKDLRMQGRIDDVFAVHGIEQGLLTVCPRATPRLAHSGPSRALARCNVGRDQIGQFESALSDGPDPGMLYGDAPVTLDAGRGPICRTEG